jgi:hypothetical protein
MMLMMMMMMMMESLGESLLRHSWGFCHAESGLGLGLGLGLHMHSLYPSIAMRR